ncbi:MAG: HD domain-containing protein [Nitrospinae bacterium]|nr:HD domain-containing protein [Nitrospinota bacterium]
MESSSRKSYSETVGKVETCQIDISKDAKTYEEAIELLKLTREQSLAYSRDLVSSYKEEKSHRRALKIANFQIKHFLKAIDYKTESLNRAYIGTLRCLALAADFKDECTGEHIIRMSRYMAYLATLSGYSINDAKDILFVAPMHDIGKIGVPDSILNKTGVLTNSERQAMQSHPIYGAEILSGSDSELIRLAKEITLSHHERWDGNGYPIGLKEEQIPKVGRIAAIADVFDALTIARPYKKALSFEMAYDLILREKGRAFDPGLVEIFEKNIDKFEEIKSNVDLQESSLSKAKLLMENETQFLDWLCRSTENSSS